jgi:hypothetical protein
VIDGGESRPQSCDLEERLEIGSSENELRSLRVTVQLVVKEMLLRLAVTFNFPAPETV